MIMQVQDDVAPRRIANQQLVRWGNTDASRRYVSDNPTNSKFVSLLRATDQGDIGSLLELHEEMQAKDSDYQGLVSTRIAAINALKWIIQPDNTRPELQEIADEAAFFVQEVLSNLETFEDTLMHLSEATITNVACTEIVWQLQNKRQPILKTEDVPGHKLRTDPREGPTVLVEVDYDSKFNTVSTAIPGKFIVYTPKARAGFPLRITIARAQVWIYLMKHYVQADWAAFSELFGMPLKLATVSSGSVDDVKNEVEQLFQNMTADTYAIFPEGVDIKLLEANRGAQPYEGFLKRLDERQQILILGQTLTTTAGPVGSLALGEVHDNVRTDILISDIKSEASMIRNQLIKPLVSIGFPNQNVPIPHFQRKIIESKNLDAERLELEKLKYMKEADLDVDEEVIYERLGFPKPKKPNKNQEATSGVREP